MQIGTFLEQIFMQSMAKTSSTDSTLEGEWSASQSASQVDGSHAQPVGPWEELFSMMMWYGDGMTGWGYVLMTVGMVAFWALVIVGIVMLVRASTPRPTPPPPPAAAVSTPTAEEIVAMRFARGEIDEDEYRQRLNALHSHRPGPGT